MRAVAAAEASFGAAALGGTFREEPSEGERRSRSGAEENPSSSDEGDAKTRSKKTAFSFEENGGFGGLSRKRPAHDRKHTPPHDPYEILDDVRYGLSGAFGSLEACERLASSLGARPSERASEAPPPASRASPSRCPPPPPGAGRIRYKNVRPGVFP